jgi:hypothetical protein
MRMKCLVMIVLLLALAWPAVAADSYPINVYPCPKAPAPPAMDGKLDDAVWQEAPLVSGFTLFGQDTLAPLQTSFRLLWDEKCLYLGVHCDEPQMAKLNPIRYAHDEHAVFGNETIEFFVDPNHTHDRYYQLAFNAAGSLYDGEREATVWNSDAEVKAFLGKDFWSVEVAVPWGPLKARPEVGKVIGFNVNRDRNIGSQMWCTWARVMNGFHDPDRFAHLVLSGTPETIGKVAAEFRKGGRTGPIVVYSSEGFAQTSYANLSKAAFAQVGKLLADLDSERQKETDPAAAAEIGKRLAEYAAKVTTLKQHSDGKLDAASWTRLDLELQGIEGALRRIVSEARLTALLNSI